MHGCDFNVSVSTITVQLLLCNLILYEFTIAATTGKSQNAAKNQIKKKNQNSNREG